jgi:MerR family Zn(II)-responsive transcriptional regulator of zntA
MFTIGKLAGLAATSTDTLRYYERERLIAPADRTESGYRLYDHDNLRRLHFIKQAQQCGFTLTEIRELLALRGSRGACCGDVRSRAVEKKLQIEHKIKAMMAMSKALDELIADCTDGEKPVEACGILAALERASGDR